MRYKVLYNGLRKEVEATGFKETISGFISFYQEDQPVLVVAKDSVVFIEKLEDECLQQEPQDAEIL